jgi:hypothetical protein
MPLVTQITNPNRNMQTRLAQDASRDRDEVEDAIRKVISQSRFDNVPAVETILAPHEPRRKRWFRFRNGNPDRTRVAFPPSPVLAFLHSRLKRYRPRWSHNLALLLLAGLIYNPWGVLFSLALLSAILLSVYFLAGPDRIGGLARRFFVWFERANPGRAESLLKNTSALSKKLERLSARLPERWTQGLYFPSFEREPDLPEKMTQDPFERLKSQLHDASPDLVG